MTSWAENAHHRARRAPKAAEPQPAAEPCPEGFVWIGQSFAHCDACGLPAWDHAGWSEPNGELLSPFDMRPWVLKPFEPGEAAAVRAKWAARQVTG